jgi:hypothetical protein
MVTMPKWNEGIGLLIHPERGRGVKALRSFKKGDALLWYDGHRVDDRGNIRLARAAVQILYASYGLDPESTEFQKTHALCLGRTHITDLVIDGYHLSLPVFDKEELIGRGAVANSGTPKESNMICVWVRAPDLPPDPITKIRDCEAILIARRDIR